jgi:UDP-hydrolysing UDP-N-acetyl-D-glucosamine 2-epimerase
MKICVVTGTRAEFGLLQGLMGLIDASENYELQVVVTGTHLLEEFGHTVNAITDAGFTIDARVPQITHAVSGSDVATQVGEGIVVFNQAFSELQPDALVVLGDRYEMLAASMAAFFLEIPILHIHGGEVTHGAFDDTIRHAITKLATLHCVAHEDYARRVIQLGEQPERVHVVGGLGVDQLAETELLSKGELERELGLELGEPLFLVTYHPVTSGVSDAVQETRQLIAALEEFPDATVIVTMPNADPDHQTIASALVDAVARHPGRWLLSASLGQVRYWSLMALATAVVGNSSSGILEAPSFPTPTVNIGPRQTGRIMAGSVLSCAPDATEISGALRQVLEPDFRQSLHGVQNRLGGPGASERIVALLPNLGGATLKGKVFYDLSSEEMRPPSAHS